MSKIREKIREHFEYHTDVGEYALELILEKSEEILAKSFDKFIRKGKETGYTKFVHFENQVRWVTENSKKKPKMPDSEKGSMHPVVKDIVKDMEKGHKDLEEDTETLKMYYRTLSIEGKKKIINHVVSDLVENGWFRMAWNKTRQSQYFMWVEKHHNEPLGDDYKVFEGKALVCVYPTYIRRYTAELKQYETRERVDFDSYGYFEQKLSEAIEEEKLKNNIFELENDQ